MTRAKKKVILLANDEVLHPPLAVCENAKRQDGLRLLKLIEERCSPYSERYPYSSYVKLVHKFPATADEGMAGPSAQGIEIGKPAYRRQGSSVGTHLSNDGEVADADCEAEAPDELYQEPLAKRSKLMLEA